MKRAQVLLTEDLDHQIKKIAKNQNLSQSEVVRRLLVDSLGDQFARVRLDQKKTTHGLRLLNLSNYRAINPRIDGFREIFSVGGKTTEIRILPDEVFRYYKNRGRLPRELEYQVLKTAEEFKKLSMTKKLVVRRAYVVPGLENPPGPRFLGLDSEKVILAIHQIYNFAIEHEYDLAENSQICAFFYPFADPKPLLLPIKRRAVLPYGGYAVPLNNKSTRVEVFATWGNNEGVQTFDAIDRYTVDAQRKIILQKDIPQKTLMLCTTGGSQSERLAVPQDRQFEQVLSDTEILEAGRLVFEMTKKYGLRRIEFSFDGKDSIVFNESIPYKIYEEKLEKIDKKGTIFVVDSERAVEKLRRMKPKESVKTIVYIDKSIVQDRAYDVLNSVASLATKFTVLYPGLSATAHAMRVLNDFGHTAIVVGNRVFKNHEEILIKSKNSQIFIDRLSKKVTQDLAVHLYDARLFGRELVGGKAMNLSILKSKGFNVPHGTVLTTKFALGYWPKIEKTTSWGKRHYAVRSSADVEDTTEHAFAGQFKSFLNVKRSDLRSKVEAVIESKKAPRVKKYLSALGKTKPIKMAVVIQEMVDAAKSGVVFGKDLETGNTDWVVIDVTRGLGEGVVEGTAKTQRIVYSKSKDQVVNGKTKRSEKILSRMETDSLVEMAKSLESLMGEPQDIEWSIDKSGQIWLIQTRGLK